MPDSDGPEAKAEGPQPAILIGDDDPALVAGLSETLAAYGFPCDWAGDWPALMERLQAAPYDLVILEMRLGHVDLVDRFAELASCTSAPIVFLTGDGSETDGILALEKGAAGVLRKPISGREVVARVRAYLRREAASPPPPEPQRTWRIGCGQLGLAALIAPLDHLLS